MGRGVRRGALPGQTRYASTPGEEIGDVAQPWPLGGVLGYSFVVDCQGHDVHSPASIGAGTSSAG